MDREQTESNIRDHIVNLLKQQGILYTTATAYADGSAIVVRVLLPDNMFISSGRVRDLYTILHDLDRHIFSLYIDILQQDFRLNIIYDPYNL